MDKQSEESTGTWYVIRGVFGTLFCRTLFSQANVFAQHEKGGTIRCDSVWEFIASLNQMQAPDGRVAISKQPIVTPYCVQAYDAECSIDLTGTVVTPFANLHASDRALYDELLALGKSMSDGWVQARMKATSGIEVASEADLRSLKMR